MLECTRQNGTVADGFPQLWSGNPSRAFTEASGHVTTVYVLSQFHSLRRKKVFPTGEYPSLCFHSFHKARVHACAGVRLSEMPWMCLRLNDETPHRSGTKSSAGEMIVYLSTTLNSHLFLFLFLFVPEVIRLFLFFFFFWSSHHWREDEPFCSDPDTCACSCYASIMVLLHYSLRIDGHNGTGPSWTFCVHCYRIVKQRPFSHTNQANQGAVKEIY